MDASSVKGVLHNKWFYCDHLGSSENDLTDIKTFSVRDPDMAGGLSNYLQNVVKHPEWKGLGVMIFDSFIRPLASQVASISGTMLLYIFALPFDSLIDQYRKAYRFLRLEKKDEDDLHKRLKPFYDQSCIFMFQML